MLEPLDERQLTDASAILMRSDVFYDVEELLATWRAEPWRILGSDRGELAVVSRWREHLDILSVERLHCEERRVHDLLVGLGPVMDRLGLARITSPLLDGIAVSAYRRAGMHPFREVVLYTSDQLPKTATEARFDVEEARAEDASALVDLEGEALEPFWRYDARHVRRALERERCGLVREAGSVVAYVSWGVSRGAAYVGRLAVRPDARRRGIARTLLRHALTSLREEGAQTVTVSTQSHNRAARSLYRSEGFRESRSKLHILISDKL
jgi:ribosomal-protein-alanine N-acetyltransferase